MAPPGFEPVTICVGTLNANYRESVRYEYKKLLITEMVFG